jgi:hypothetical protein
MGKEATWECIDRWWYDVDIFFNATNFLYCQPMIDVIVHVVRASKVLVFLISGGQFYRMRFKE